MSSLRWHTDERYYCATLQRDLFGGLLVMQCWGGRKNNLGGVKEFPVQDLAQGKAALYRIAQRRAQRDYQLVTPLAVPRTSG